MSVPTAGIAAATVAIGVPVLLAVNLPPSSTLLNQAAALMGWGVWLSLVVASLPRGVGRGPGGQWAWRGALVLLAASALTTPFWTGQPWSLALSNVGTLAAAALVAQVGATAQQRGAAVPVFRAFCIGLVATGLACTVVGLVQVFAPALADGNFIAQAYLPGRAVGNMRQPNHLSSLMLWATVAALWLGESGTLRRWVGQAVGVLFVFVVVLTGSRTGALSMLVLAGWGLLDRRLAGSTRRLLLLAPVLYAVFWFGIGAWADYSQQVFGGGERFKLQGDVSSSRFAIWSNALALIRQHPWAGVGFGEFNFAWTLTPFPQRPTEFFDHAHDIVLQFAVELGLPLAALVLGLLLAAVAGALRAALAARTDPDPRQAPLRRAAFVMLLLILTHSLLEYPLWYAYFLLPTAFVFGLCAAPALASPSAPTAAAPERTRPLLLASMLMTLAGFTVVLDYLRVVAIYTAEPAAPPLAERITDGRRSLLFAHHAEYAAATTATRPGEALPAFASASHYLLDARLLQAWATALNDAGDVDRARYVADRLREFRNDAAAPFFQPCTETPSAAMPLPFQCVPATRRFSVAEFR